MNELTYLPSGLLKVFFDDKPIEFRMKPNEELKKGRTSITVFGGGQCDFQIFYSASCDGVYHSASPILSSEMLDRVLWDAKNQTFCADFSGLSPRR